MDDVIKNMDNKNPFEIINSPHADDFEKIFAIINLSEIKTIADFHIFINCLTNHSSPLREAAALKLGEFYKDKDTDFFDEFIKKQILGAIIDINPNVSRSVCSVIKSNSKIKDNIEFDIILMINSILDEIKILNKKENKIQNRKNHAKNKKIFSLYWLLEALFCCHSKKYNSEVLEILKVTINFCDYTIREKTAKILMVIDNPPDELLNCIKNDQNFYVKNQVYDKMNFED